MRNDKHLSIPLFDAARFTWRGNRGSCEASDLKDASYQQGFQGNVTGRVWNDSADLGFELLSRKTGRLELFVLEQTHTDREGEVTHWTLRGCGRPDLTVLVFND